MTKKIDLNQEQLRQIRTSNQETCQGISVRKPITDGTSFIFFAAFDGTNNDKDSVPRGELCTNVGQLWNQYQGQHAGGEPRYGGGYYKGPGVPGTLSGSSWLPGRVKEQVIKTADDAYQELCEQASTIPDLDKVAVAITSFSRGGASAAIFAQMLYQRGLMHSATRNMLIPPKEVPVVGGVIFDPVMTGVNTSLAYPPNVSNLIGLRALNEYRYLFAGANYSNHPEAIIRTYSLYGNHCDVGGGYDNGLAGLALETATAALRKLGLPLADVPAQRAYYPEQIAVHSEEYDNYGNKIWDVSNEDGFSFRDIRPMADIGSPFGEDLSGRDRFLTYNGDVIY